MRSMLKSRIPIPRPSTNATAPHQPLSLQIDVGQGLAEDLVDSLEEIQECNLSANWSDEDATYHPSLQRLQDQSSARLQELRQLKQQFADGQLTERTATDRLTGLMIALGRLQNARKGLRQDIRQRQRDYPQGPNDTLISRSLKANVDELDGRASLLERTCRYDVREANARVKTLQREKENLLKELYEWKILSEDTCRRVDALQVDDPGLKKSCPLAPIREHAWSSKDVAEGPPKPAKVLKSSIPVRKR